MTHIAKMVPLNILIGYRQQKKLRRLARLTDISMSEHVRRALDAYLTVQFPLSVTPLSPDHAAGIDRDIS